jgi:hypothetical protein
MIRTFPWDAVLSTYTVKSFRPWEIPPSRMLTMPTTWPCELRSAPPASPLFNYNFARQDDVVKFGFTVSLSAPTPAAAPIYPVKAPMLK